MNSQEVDWLLQEKYNGQESSAFWADVTRLEAGEPLAFVIGSIPFLDTTIYLDSHPLIPRPETEFWVEQAIKAINAYPVQKHSLCILDLCAGSGCIGVAVAKACPAVQVDFSELQSAHLPTIAKNCRANDISAERVFIYESDLFTPVKGGRLRKYDFILSNPPYIDKSLGRTESSVITHEPALALFGGVAGMEVLAQIIADAPQYLQAGGQLWLEHEPEQAAAICLLGAAHFSVTTHEDQYNVPRFSKLVLQSLHESIT